MFPDRQKTVYQFLASDGESQQLELKLVDFSYAF